MNYNYNIGDKKVRVWVWDGGFINEVTVYTEDGCYDRTVRQDEQGERFFTWNKEKVYLKDYIKITLKEVKEKIEKGEHLIGDDLTQAILNEGIEKVRFICPLHPINMVVPQLGFAFCDGGKYVNTLCKITEDRYKVAANYKIGVESIDNNRVGSDSYYVNDMLSLIQSGHIKIV